MKIEKPKDPNNLSDFEKMHIPSVEIPYQPMKGEIFELIVKVGEITHGIAQEHFIQAIELYNNNILLDKVEIGPQVEPECIFKVSYLDNTCFRVIARCNLHGNWEKVIRVGFD